MTESIIIEEVEHYILKNFTGVMPKDAWGEVSYFYNPGNHLPRGTYFLTIKQADGDNDKASDLDREGVWRLNFGVERKTFEGIFGPPPARPAKGMAIEGPWDFTQLDTLTPHPIYGWMSWMAINCPSQPSWEFCKPLVDNAYHKAKAAFDKRMAKG